MASKSDGISLLENPQAPDIFASGSPSIFVLDGNIVITLESQLLSHATDGSVTRVRKVVGQLIMPIPGVQKLIVDLNSHLEQWGLSPSVAATGGDTVQ